MSSSCRQGLLRRNFRYAHTFRSIKRLPRRGRLTFNEKKNTRYKPESENGRYERAFGSPDKVNTSFASNIAHGLNTNVLHSGTMPAASLGNHSDAEVTSRVPVRSSRRP